MNNLPSGLTEVPAHEAEAWLAEQRAKPDAEFATRPDGQPIYLGITEEEWALRLDTYHRPYHRAVERTIAKAGASGRAPLVLSLHSFTPFWKGVPRPWHAAVLWDSDHRAVLPFLKLLRQPGDILVGDNEPYDGALKGDTM